MTPVSELSVCQCRRAVSNFSLYCISSQLFLVSSSVISKNKWIFLLCDHRRTQTNHDCTSFLPSPWIRRHADQHYCRQRKNSSCKTISVPSRTHPSIVTLAESTTLRRTVIKKAVHQQQLLPMEQWWPRIISSESKPSFQTNPDGGAYPLLTKRVFWLALLVITSTLSHGVCSKTRPRATHAI